LTSTQTLLRDRLLSIVRRFPQQKVLVVGDSIADQFIFGAIGRVSREAPVLILRHEQTETVPGGAANCAVNLASLGGKVSLISVAGEDEAGRVLVAKLKSAGVDCNGVLVTEGLRTTTKTRILAGHLHSTRQQVIRIDYEGDSLNDPALLRLRERVYDKSLSSDAIILSDYNYGVAAPDMAAFVRDIALTRRIPLLADSRFRLSSFGGLTSATPNQDEVEQLLGKSFTDPGELKAAAEQLRAQLGYRALLVTRGSLGLMLLEDGVEALQLDAVGASEPVDVTGAGDTVIATYALALAADASFPDAARLANYAGGLVVMKRGTSSITGQELANSIMKSDAL